MMNVEEKGREAADENGLIETVKTVALALLIAVVIRAFLFQPFNIPSGSMIPTLLEGDFIFVSKYAYGYSRYSLPFGPPLFEGRIFGSDPERGDVVVFRNHPDEGPASPRQVKDYIKRVIGLPGDRIQVRDGILHINGAPVPRERLADYVPVTGFRHGTVQHYRETLPNGVTYATLDLCPPTERCRADNTGEYVVPEGKYFVMGDNRDNSQDSRFPEEVGFVDAEELIGRAEIIFFSFYADGEPLKFWKWPLMVRWGRLFSGID